ncbi:hypothetical protein ACP70R_049436 [Stipagrostis hirtigluma subsp. patula]
MATARRVVLEAAHGSPESAMTGKLRELVDNADNATNLADSAEAALLAESKEAAKLLVEKPENRARVKDWLHKAREAMYRLDDALDGYNGSVARRQDQQPHDAGRSSIFRRFRSSSTAVHEGEFKTLKITVEKLEKNMHEILKEGADLGLDRIDSKKQSWISKFACDPTPIIIGDVEHEKLKVISMLTDSQSTCPVVVIVGCGGSGKTTLARNVFDDHHTRNAFTTVLWVCGSEDFTEAELLSAISTAAGFKAVGVGDMKKLEDILLAFMLGGKRFLLVIDDIGSKQISENLKKICSPEVFENPQMPFQHGSRILITTRDKSVAELMGSERAHQVKELRFEDCWSLLSSIACLDDKQHEILRPVGIKILQKCNRVPLALQLIGGVLRTKDPTWEEWQKVSEYEEGWSTSGIDTVPDNMKEVAGVICMAYRDLPPRLKQCFRYCLHLPSGFKITRYSVTELWISEDFIEEQDGCSFGETAEKYYKELVLRNLLQPEIGSPDMTRCTVNGCVRSLLQLLTKDLWSRKSRSVASTSREERGTPAYFRTAILHKNPSGDRVLDNVNKNLKSLRVLDLTGTGIRDIPASLGNLLHLRFLNLSHTEIMELPESIGNLRNLQFLVLRCCYRLHSLPDGISKLQNLQTLDLESTEPDQVPPRLTSLKQLTTLHGFVVNSYVTKEHNSGWPLEDLKHMNSLRSLQIVKIDRIQQHLCSQEAALSLKQHLTHLELRGSMSSAGTVHVVDEKEAKRLNDVLKCLQPPECLESLKIVSYYGRSFSNWIVHLPSLQRLIIADCRFCENLPALGQLPQLKLLQVSGCSELRAIERRTTGPPSAFPKLEKLHLDDMQSLESWDGFQDGDLPSLAELHLQRCPRLRSLPACLGQCMLLTSMLIVSADSLDAIDGLPALRELVVRDSERLVRISNLPSLKTLTIAGCSALRKVSGLTKQLRHLRLTDRELTRLPDWLLAVAQNNSGLVPETLAIDGREELLRSLVPGGKDWSAVSGVDKVYGSLLDRSPFFVYTKSPAVLKAFGDQRDLGNRSEAAFHFQNESEPSLNIMLRNFAGRIAGMGLPSNKKWCSIALMVAVSPVLLQLYTGNAEPIPMLILFAFFAATACFLYFFSYSG